MQKMKRHHLITTLTIISLLTSNFVNAQIKVQSSVWDSHTQEPIPYCYITVINGTENTIANADGKFIINTSSLSDSLFIFRIGYHKKTIAIKDIIEDVKIYLQPQSIELLAVTISANNENIYDIVSKCRKVLQKSKRTRYQKKIIV